MRSSIALAATALLSVASAVDNHHGHFAFHNKRHDTDLEQCTTIWSTWYGEATMAPIPVPPPTSTHTSTSSTTPPPPPPTTTSTTSAPAPAKTSAAPVQALAAIQKGGSGGSTTFTPSGGSGTDFFGHACGASGMNAITYSPYQGADHASSSCKTTSQIQSDIQSIHARGFNRIRIYATDCGQLQVAGRAAQDLGMRLIAGIFLNSPGSAESDFSGQLSDIQSYISGGGNNIDAVLVGNEPFKGGHADVSQVAEFLGRAKQALGNMVISTALTHDELDSYGSQLCGLMDVVAAQIHPFFSSNYIAPGGAGGYVESEMGIMSNICGGKPVFVSESGYPNNGGSWLSQIAGAFEQQAAIGSIKRSDKSNHITLFSSSSDTWKLAPGVQAYEAAFDCLDLF